MTIPQVSGYGNYLYQYQAYTPPQFNNWNNYGYSTPVFRGAEYQPIVQQPLSRDTVELSAEKEIKTKKKEGLSTGAKLAIGLATTAATIYGGVVLHRHLTKPSIEKVAKNFSEIFRRDVSKEEALKITERYKEIYKISDTKTFIEKMNNQIKNDFGYENININLDIGSASGSWNKVQGKLNVTPIDKNLYRRLKHKNKNEIFSTIMHEYTHVKQTEFAYRTNPKKFNEALITRAFNSNYDKEYSALKLSVEKYAQKHNLKIEDAKRKFLQDELKNEQNNYLLWMDEAWGKLEKFKPDSESYRKGCDYIKSNANYTSAEVNYDEYYKNLLEKEAWHSGNLAKQIFNYCATPWRLF